MLTIIIVILLVCLVGWAGYKTVQKFQKGGGCCGEHDQTAKRIHVQDIKKRNYHYKYTLNIGGMTCENCAIQVENALNSLPDTWAKVDIAEKKASLLTKKEPDFNQIRKAVNTAGYTVTDISAK